MKIVVISDTHGGHRQLGQLSGDVLIHCGDFENLFRPNDKAIADLDAWFGKQDFKHILCIGGNHDLLLESRVPLLPQPFRNATYLQDAGITINGLNFYGAPWVPELRQHAFFATSRQLKRAWRKIPSNVDVLITHTPPAGVLDQSSRGRALGCEYLAKRVTRLTPRLHCFGHVHANAGCRVAGGTTYVNATSVNSALEIVHSPFEFDLNG